MLVDGLWPRGVSKDDAALDAWQRELAPTARLRRWFGHDPERWEGFRARYFDELDERKGAVRELVARVREGRVTLVYGARDEAHNNAVALRDYLRAKAAGRRRPRR